MFMFALLQLVRRINTKLLLLPRFNIRINGYFSLFFYHVHRELHGGET